MSSFRATKQRSLEVQIPTLYFVLTQKGPEKVSLLGPVPSRTPPDLQEPGLDEHTCREHA